MQYNDVGRLELVEAKKLELHSKARAFQHREATEKDQVYIHSREASGPYFEESRETNELGIINDHAFKV